MINITIENQKNKSEIKEYIASIDKDTTYIIIKNDNEIFLIISIKYLSWDSNIFKKKIGLFDVCYGKLNNEYIDIIMDNINEFCISEKYDCIFAKANIDEYYKMHILESKGYNLMDSIVTLKTNLKSNENYKSEKNYKSRILTNSDLPDVLNIIDNLYSFGRFFEDSKLDNSDVNTLYKQWITNEIINENVDVIGIEKTNKIVGFISCKYRESKLHSKPDGIISLVGIDKSCQGMGIGKQLMNSVLNNFKEKDIDEVFVGTQINNLAALNFYISNGFRVCDSVKSFHKWFSRNK